MPTSETAAASRANADARAEAQGPYVANPGVKMCIWEAASEEERKALDAGGTSAEATVAEAADDAVPEALRGVVPDAATDAVSDRLTDAVPGFERWFGKRPDVDSATRAAALR